MTSSIKKLLGIAPKHLGNETYSPSPVALNLATKKKTDYEHTVYKNAYTKGDVKILMVCTEEGLLTMQNGKKFSTGNHPVEMLVPMLHFEQAGFEVEIFTPTGKPVKIEMWAMPDQDQAVKSIYEKYQHKFKNPGSLPEFIRDSMNDTSPYAAVFLPGGHGATLGLPDNEDLGKIIHWAFGQDKFILAICHGPAALLAAKGMDNASYLFSGYEMAVFPDGVDKTTPLFGYMPGKLTWYFGEELKNRGVIIINNKASGICHHDKKLITGDSPMAANEFGKISAQALLAQIT